MPEAADDRIGRIRRASPADVGAITRLVKRAQTSDAIPRICEDEIRALMSRGEIIVLGLRPHELVAAACLTKAAGHGHLAFLVVDPAFPGLEDRIRSAATALSDAA